MLPELNFSVAINLHSVIIRARHADTRQIVWQSIGKSAAAGWMQVAAILYHMRYQHQLVIGTTTAECVILQIGSALPLDVETSMQIQGTDVVSGDQSFFEIASDEAREALDYPLALLVEDITTRLKPDAYLERAIASAQRSIPPMYLPNQLKPALENVIIELTGIFGGIAKLDQRLNEATGLAFAQGKVIKTHPREKTFFRAELLD